MDSSHIDSKASPYPRISVFIDLPEPILHEVLEFLSLTDRRRVVATCQRFWEKRFGLEGKIRSLRLYSRNELQGPLVIPFLGSSQYGPVLRNVTNLMHLNVGSFANNNLLYLLPTAPCHATLESLSMVGSCDISDTGLMFLARANPNGGDIRNENLRQQMAPDQNPVPQDRTPHKSSPLSALKSIDLTFCRNTTFAGTFWLRDGIPRLQCIQRVPQWCQGRFTTPFGDGETEVHTYWPDGIFSFTRAFQSSGFVVDVFAWDNKEPSETSQDDFDYEAVDFLGSKLQLLDSQLRYLPEVGQLAYRPGVSLLRLSPETNADGSTTTSVLVGQYVTGLKPPGVRRWMERALNENIALGESNYYAIDRTPGVPDDEQNLRNAKPAEEYARDPTGPRPELVMSKMKLEPFHTEASNGDGSNNFNAPLDLVEACRRKCQAIQRYSATTLQRVEDEIDRVLTNPEEQEE
ncbi:MAG: hypothetical protein SGARI_001881 [Bacillariaceae sp.]